MADIKLKIIKKPAEGTATILKTDKRGDFRFFKGDGPDNLLCGYCGYVLCEEIQNHLIRGFVFECPGCRKYNDKA